MAMSCCLCPPFFTVVTNITCIFRTAVSLCLAYYVCAVVVMLSKVTEGGGASKGVKKAYKTDTVGSILMVQPVQ